MKDFFSELFDYNHNMNGRLLEVFFSHRNDISDYSIQLMSHIANAHHIWNSRVLLQRYTYAVWDIHDPETIALIDKENHTTSLTILDQTDMEHAVVYSNTRGEQFSNTVRDIFFHIINHSNYHRAQVVADLKRNGLPTVVTDYIFYKR